MSEQRKGSGLFVLGMVVVAGLLTASASGAAPEEARADQLRHMLVQECGSCHGLHMRGGLGPPLTPDVLEQSTDEALAAAILEGVSGTAMPPWSRLVSEDEARWLVELLRQGVDP